MTELSRRRTRRAPTRLLPLLILAVTLVCASATACTGPSTAASAGAAPVAREPGHAAAVLTEDASGLRRRRQLFGALQILTQRCMRDRGLRYLVTSAGPLPPAGATTADTIGSRSAPGYGISTALGRMNRGPTAQDRYVRSLSAVEQARYTTALDGPADRTAPLTLPSGASGSYATGGCVARARAGLYGTVRAALEDTLVPQDVDHLLERYLTTDSSYQRALKRWQHCMDGAGHAAKTPAALIQSLQARAVQGASAPELAREQRAAATADQRCDAESGLRSTAAAQRDVFLRSGPAGTRARLETVWQHRQQALTRAAALLGQDPG
ncbi:hypothetical protein [Streptomyces shenzhenensis]|uniref:hypothetical protein n=1 Tax=Streptomyces shenzhenensis TaxID=943815 RepID=UPI001F33243E|nr:hypothetical protein [Streptomyces shenzhenensis]